MQRHEPHTYPVVKTTHFLTHRAEKMPRKAPQSQITKRTQACRQSPNWPLHDFLFEHQREISG
jgi:hypothetical protein